MSTITSQEKTKRSSNDKKKVPSVLLSSITNGDAELHTGEGGAIIPWQLGKEKIL